LSASGYRLSNSGNFTNIGTQGYWWSSTAYSAGAVGYGYNQYLNATYVSGGFDQRATTCPVRCLQEFTACPAGFFSIDNGQLMIDNEKQP